MSSSPARRDVEEEPQTPQMDTNNNYNSPTRNARRGLALQTPPRHRLDMNNNYDDNSDDDDDSVVPATPQVQNNNYIPGTPLTPLSDLDVGLENDDNDEEEEDDDEVQEGNQNNNIGIDMDGEVRQQEDNSNDYHNTDNNNNGEENQQDEEQAAAAAPLLLDQQQDEVALIRGTNVHVPTAAAAFTDFIRNFRSLPKTRPNNDDDDDSDLDMDDDNNQEPPPPLYLSRLESLLTRGAIFDDNNNNTNFDHNNHNDAATSSTGTASLDIDTIHLYFHSPECQRFYQQLVAYPMELVPLMDLLCQRELQRLANEYTNNNDVAQQPLFFDEQDLPRIQVRPYNLKDVSNIRQLDPISLDSLLCIKGMIVRTSPIIPDLKVAHFSCCICGHNVQVTIDRGKIQEPNGQKCAQCNTNDTFTLVHNRSVFADKQLVRIQETPDEVPAGQTPASVLTFAFDDLVDTVKPGDKVEVTGVLRAQPIRINPKITKLKSVYKTYVDVIHFKRITGMTATNNTNTDPHGVDQQEAVADGRGRNGNSGGMKIRFTPERVKQLQDLSNRSDIYEQLTASLAPSIWGLDDVKKGVLCMLFGGNHVRVKKGTAARRNTSRRGRSRIHHRHNVVREIEVEDDGSMMQEDNPEDDENENDMDPTSSYDKLHKRGDINILLCGDPGTSKSQLLSYVNKLTARGVYTSGKGSSAVGLTASVVRDPETRDLVLESGALVLSDLGICIIDEFDKMSDTTRSVLHEAMEQQTVSIAKAGIIATLNARTSILASANPTESRYNPNLSVVDNIKLPPTLLSRFDLIYLILDNPNVEHDRKLAQHLVGLYYETPNVTQPLIDIDLLRDYIDFAKMNVCPELSNDASEQLIASYLEMRNPLGSASGGGGNRTISATPRQLESLIRLSEGLAKMRYSPIVTRADALEAVRLMKVATQAAATDPRTGRIDMDMIATGRSTADREMEEQLSVTIKELLTERRGSRLSVQEVTRQLSEITNNTSVQNQNVIDCLRRMEADGVVQFNERAQTVFVRSGIVH